MTQESPRDGLDPPDFGAPRDGRHAPEAVQSLKQAMRRARFDDAERVGALADLRETKIGRLELLQDALNPLLAQVPQDVDLFDVGIMPGPTPRLFIDMIGFIEMARDARVYRFLQDTRHNRVTIAESSDVATMVDAVTDYVARRLLEREKALASDALDAGPPFAPERASDRMSNESSARFAEERGIEVPDRPRRRKDRRTRDAGQLGRAARWGGITFAFIIDLLGAIAFFSILAFVGWLLWNHVLG